MTEFAGLKLAQPLLRAIKNEGYDTPTPIQAKAIPPLLEGRDMLGIAQTGTGKTAAFALPLLQRLAESGKPQHKRPLALILAPTRELAGQINDSLRTYGRNLRLYTTVAFGGTSIRPQIKAMARGTHILVSTPGRLLDLMNQGHVKLDRVQVFILDEADRMLDMGFIHDVKKVAALMPATRQTVMFSATMPNSVMSLASGLLTDPVRVEVSPGATTVEKIEQSVLFLPKDKKRSLLSDLLDDKDFKRVLIFTRTKHGADRVTRHLNQKNISADAIHGNKSQNARQRALKDFKGGRIRALVATDIAARGLDVDGITHVINFDLPNEPESYVHRIGRTARAGAGGIAISLCEPEERTYLRDIEKTIRQIVPVNDDHPYHLAEIVGDPGNAKKPSLGRKRQGGFSGQRRKFNKGPGKSAGKSSGGHPSRRPKKAA